MRKRWTHLYDKKLLERAKIPSAWGFVNGA